MPKGVLVVVARLSLLGVMLVVVLDGTDGLGSWGGGGMIVVVVVATWRCRSTAPSPLRAAVYWVTPPADWSIIQRQLLLHGLAAPLV